VIITRKFYVAIDLRLLKFAYMPLVRKENAIHLGEANSMATRDFEVKQLLRAYRNGVISEELFAGQITELCAAGNGDSVPNVFAHRGDGAKVSTHTLGKPGQSETMVFSLPAHFGNDRENSHRGDQSIYVSEGKAVSRVLRRDARSRLVTWSRSRPGPRMRSEPAMTLCLR
jgi:hypothetical protein